MVNPFADAKKQARSTENLSSIDYCQVVEVGANRGHTVRVVVKGDDGATFSASVLVPTSGDVNVPKPGSIVAVGYAKNGIPIVLGTVYTESSEVPDYQKNKRTLSHPATDSEITFDPDGVITITHDSGSTITMAANGDIKIDTSGKVLLGDSSGTFAPVARKGDAISVNGPDSTSGQIEEGSSNVEAS